MEATKRRLRYGAGLLILVGMFLVKAYGWPAGANLIENGLAVLAIAAVL